MKTFFLKLGCFFLFGFIFFLSFQEESNVNQFSHSEIEQNIPIPTNVMVKEDSKASLASYASTMGFEAYKQ